MPEKLTEKREAQEIKVQRPKRAKLTAEESLKRMEEFPQRKEQIIAAVRKSQSRGLSCFIARAYADRYSVPLLEEQ